MSAPDPQTDLSELLNPFATIADGLVGQVGGALTISGGVPQLPAVLGF